MSKYRPLGGIDDSEGTLGSCILRRNRLLGRSRSTRKIRVTASWSAKSLLRQSSWRGYLLIVGYGGKDYSAPPFELFVFQACRNVSEQRNGNYIHGSFMP
mmetsp:Transcript_15467/g.37085  ORF Transcript_15467/g.37085 Transcript_15467/m.37085 type:complete len:100 (-) Transcript_15467:173-472(-)